MSLFTIISERLGLQPASRTVSFGTFEGFPMAIEELDWSDNHWEFAESGALYSAHAAAGGAKSMLLHVRHAIARDRIPPAVFEPSEADESPWPSPLAEAMKREEASAEIDDRIAWLTLRNLRSESQVDPVVELIEAFLQGLQNVGIPSLADRCHQCGRRSCKMQLERHRVVQVCAPCKEEHLTALGRDGSGVGVMTLGLLAATSLATIVGAACWAFEQFGLGLLMTWWMGDIEEPIRIHGPVIAFVIAYGFFGGLVGYPIGWTISRFRNRPFSSAGLAGFCTIVAILIGEFAFFTAVISQEVGVLTIDGRLVLTATWESMDFPFMVHRLMAGIMALAIAARLACVKVSPL